MSDFDAVIIGSGAGGMAAAVALARAGEKVLVLEQHDTPGGWCHSFTLEGHKFSPGVHYIGELQPGGRMRRIYEGLGVGGDLTFLELDPDGFDRIQIGDVRYDIPAGRERFAETLSAQFPHEREGIHAYLRACQGIADGLAAFDKVRGPKDVAALPFKAPDLVRYGFMRLDKMVGGFVKDPTVRAILTMQAGDHGMPPSRCRAMLHCSVQSHYFHGGWYPMGGGMAIPRAFLRALKRHGGELRLKTRVSRILVEGAGSTRRAVGVRLDDGTEIRAKRVISNADPGVTFGRLVDPEHQSWRLRRRLARTTYGISAVSLFMAVEMDARAAGLSSANLWYGATPDIDGIYQLGRDRIRPGAVERYPGAFLTVTSLKDPSKAKGNLHTMESFALVEHDAFRQWADTRFGARPDGYQAFKDELTRAHLRTLEDVVPGITERVVFSDLGTPLTNVHYCEATGGSLYGTEKRLRQLGPFGYPIQTEIDGLLMCGASTIAHGVLGATLSGLFAAGAALKCHPYKLLDATGPALVTLPADRPETWPAEYRRKLDRVEAA